MKKKLLLIRQIILGLFAINGIIDLIINHNIYLIQNSLIILFSLNILAEIVIYFKKKKH